MLDWEGNRCSIDQLASALFSSKSICFSRSKHLLFPSSAAKKKKRQLRTVVSGFLTQYRVYDYLRETPVQLKGVGRRCRHRRWREKENNAAGLLSL
jgi:hypothetical protein